MGRQWLVACMLLSMAMAVRAYSSGAPAAACARIYPEGHNGTSLSLSSSPFVLDIFQLYNQLGNIYYTPGYSYTLSLSGDNFRGFLVQARSSVSGTPLGKFSVGGDGSQQLSQCSPPESAVTHTSNSVKNSVSLTWTAPATGSGPIVFLYAVVVQNSAGVSTFYATLNTSIIPEGCAESQYLNGATCVTSCPSYYYGNYTTRLCVPLSSDYMAAFNATFYDVKFLNTTPANTIVFGFTLYFNPTTVPMGTGMPVVISISGNVGATGLATDYFGFTTVYYGFPYTYSFPYFLNSPSDYILTNQIYYIPQPSVSTFQFNLRALPYIDYVNVGVTIIDICQANPCYNGGTCVYTGGSTTTCTCAPGFNETTCSNDINYCTPTTCLHGGTCYDGYGTYTNCTCAPGFNGPTCSNDINYCTPTTCLNGGTCYDGYGTFTNCTCAPGFNGPTCSNDINYCTPTTCLNGGTCVEGLGPLTSCTCAVGFAGNNCNTDLPFCTPTTCLNGGTCVEVLGPLTSCNCAVGFAGSNCNTDLPFCTPTTCLNGGTCVEGLGPLTSCSCAVGFAGSNCNTDLPFCTSNTCLNGGICYDGYGTYTNCTCAPGFNGPTCFNDINYCTPTTCLNGGTCYDGYGTFTNCTCSPGFNGPTCSNDISYCTPTTCLNGGICYDGYGTFTNCTCTPGFNGPTCFNDINYCTPTTCLNGGTCIEGYGTETTCNCTYLHAGPNCNINLTMCTDATCQNGGTCALTSNGTMVMCTCASGYAGMICDLDNPNVTFVHLPDASMEALVMSCLDLQHLAHVHQASMDQPASMTSITVPPTTCLNGGTCYDGFGTFTNCTCAPGFNGPTCSNDINYCTPTTCLNGGTCVEGLGPLTSCSGAVGFAGSNCNTDLPFCTSNTCLNGGICYDGYGMICNLDNPNVTFCTPTRCFNGGSCNELFGPSTSCTCAPGFNGPTCSNDINYCTCSNDINYCTPTTCLNGGTCYDGYGTFTNCTCSPGFNGPTCSNDISYCTPTTCLNGGICYDGYGTFTNCTCTPGFNGPTCFNDINYCTPTTCLNGGTCIEGYGTETTCNCTYLHAGPNCNINLTMCTDATCQNGGTCALTSNGTMVMCTCASGYAGMICNLDNPNVTFCTPTRCFNGGSCNELFGPSTSCTCAPGFNGPTCFNDINYCTPTTCLNGGTCYDGFGTFTNCTCAPGFNGPTCSNDINYCTPTTCLNGGTCVEGLGPLTSCSCAVGFAGSNCNTDLPFCTSNTCLNGGICYDGYGTYTNCTCAPGFTGPTCSNDINYCTPTTCLNGGTCYDGYGTDTNCTCTPGFNGPTCFNDINYCTPTSCLNGGTCIDGYDASMEASCNELFGPSTSCTCAPGFNGPTCSNDINYCTCSNDINYCTPTTCLNGGTCNDGYGFNGPTCSNDINYCTPTTCLNGGTCYDGYGIYTNCTCAPGFNESTCSNDINYCTSTTCLNQGEGISVLTKHGILLVSLISATILILLLVCCVTAVIAIAFGRKRKSSCHNHTGDVVDVTQFACVHGPNTATEHQQCCPGWPPTNPKSVPEKGTERNTRGEGEGEEVAEARNEPTAAAPGVHRAEASDAARPDVRSHSPEAASPDVHVATSPDVQRLNASYVQVPPIVARCLDLGIFVMLGACSVTVPSLTSFVYFAIFLIKATLWAVHLDGWNRRLFVRLLLLVYAGCHLVVVYLYQFEVAQKLIPLQPANTTTSLVARPTELKACPNVPNNYIIGPILLFILCWLVATDLTLWLSTPRLLWKLNHTYYLLQGVDAHPAGLEHTTVNLGSEQESTHVPAQSDGPFSGGRQASRSSDNSLLRQFSCFQMKRKGKDLYHHVLKKAAALWGALMRVNFVFSIVAMMLWSVFYPCWLSLVLLLWACFIWIIPRLNPRDSLYYTSPVLVVYAMALLCLQYAYSLNGPDLPSNGSFIVIRPRVEDRSFHLAMEAVFVLLFLASLHEFVTMVKEKGSQRLSGTSQYGAIPLLSRAEAVPTGGGTDFSSHLYSTVFQLLSAYWIVLVFGAFLLAIMAGEPSWLKVVYIVVFYISLLIYQLFRSYWYHLVAPLCLISSSLAGPKPSIAQELMHMTCFLSVGILKYDPGNTRSLFETLVPLAVFIAVLAMQLRYFMFQKAPLTKATDFSLMLSVVEYFKPHSEAKLPEDHDQLDAYVEGGGGGGGGGEREGGGGGGEREGGGGGGEGGRRRTEEGALSGPQSSASSTFSRQSTTTSHATSEKAYRIVRSLAVRLRQLTVSLIYLVWRFLALHTHKGAMLTLFIVSLSQVSAAYLVLLLMAVLATPLPKIHRVLYPVITFYLGLVATAKMAYQAPLLGTHYFNLTTFCNTSGGASFNVTGTVFNDQYSPVGSDPSWFGLHKVTAGSSFASYIAGPILAALVLSLWISAQRYQDHYYMTDHISLGPEDKWSLFLGVSRNNADQSLISACKYLLNHFFEMYGLETCWSMLAIAVAVRIDIYGVFYALVLGLFMFVPRPPSRVHLVLWISYLVLHGLLLVVQYAFLLGVPKGVCLSPGTERDYPWSNMTSPEKKWLFLTQSNQQILNKNLLYALLQLMGPAVRAKVSQMGLCHAYSNLAVWFDFIKILIFKYSFWLTLFLVFLFSTLQISLFGWFYLLLCFIFLFRGQNILKDTQSHRIKWVALQIVDCAFTRKARFLYLILLNGNCNSPVYYGSSQHSDDTYNIGLWTDSVCFILLSLQIIIVDTQYAEAVKAELIEKDASSRRMNELSEQLNTIDINFMPESKFHPTSPDGTAKEPPQGTAKAQGIQDDTPPSPTSQGHHTDSQSAAEDEPRSKNGDQEEREGQEEPLYRKMVTFLMTLVEMLISWLNKNSDDYRYVVERVRRGGSDGGGGEASQKSTKPREDVSIQGDKIITQGDVIVEALHLTPSAEEKEHAREVERELIGEAERRVDKIRQLLAALYYCFLAHSEKFWIVLTFYTMFVILVRYAFQFKKADTEDKCQGKNVDQGRCPTQIVGIHYYGRDFYSHVVWDFILLMAVFVHTALLKGTAWGDFMMFVAHLRSSGSSRSARGGRDYYTIMLFFDLLVFVTIVFGASSFGISTAQGCVVQVISLVKSNTVPMGFVVFLLLQFLSMLIDRAIYLRHSIKAKFIFHVFLLLIWHVWLFFVLPAITVQTFSTNVPAQFIYFFKCFYFITSSLQIILDYPVQGVGWFLRHTYNTVSSTLFTVYKIIPLLPELREMIDWVFTDTVLDLFQWLTVQKLWYLIYHIKSRREQEKREVRILGTPPSLLVKIVYGGVLVLLFLGLIWGPLFFFSLVTETGSLNPVTSISIEVSLDGFQSLLTARQLNVSDLSEEEYDQLINKYNESIPQFASIYRMENFQKVIISNQPASIWVISPPAREQLVAKVQDSLQAHSSLNLHGSWTISRTPISTAAQIQLSGQRTIGLSNSTLQELYCSLNHTDPSCSGISAVTVEDLFPSYIYAPTTGESTGITQLIANDGYVSCALSLSSSNSSGSPEWWTLEEVNDTDPAGIDLLVYSDKVAAGGVFSSIASIGNLQKKLKLDAT
eukprot:Em0018g281a